MSVDLLGVPDVDGVEVRIEACDGPETTYRQLYKGSQSFLVPAERISEGTANIRGNAACFRITAVAYSLDCDAGKPKKNKPTDGCFDIPLPATAPVGLRVRGRVLGTTSTQVVRGDRTLTIRAVLPPGSVPFEGRTRIAATVGTLPVAIEVPYGTTHTFDHLPDGLVTRIRVTTPSAQAGIWAVGDVAPFARLDAASPSAVIDVLAGEPLPVVDAYELDDRANSQSRPPLAAGQQEAHTAHTPEDIDNIPLAVAGPGKYAVMVTPTGKRPGDLSLELRDPAGVVRGGSIRSLSELATLPIVHVTASAAGKWLATVRRNDREPVSFAYTLSFQAEP